VRPASGDPATHELADHISELHLRVHAGSLEALLAEAGRALAGLQLGGTPGAPSGPWREIDLRAADQAGLLAEWLNELIYLADTDRWVATEFEFTHTGECSVRARARGVPMAASRGLVKAATLHGLRVAPVPGGYEGEVILDV
jgi:SHS2 domain-containing protein